MLVNRPEQSDTKFMLQDFQQKNNSELLSNVGNVYQRSLSFIAKNFEHKIPPAHSLEQIDIDHIEDMRKHVKEYVQKLELVKIKDGLKIAMAASSIVNNYIQNSEGFKLFKTNKP